MAPAFVGRSRELDQVERLLSGSRLVTVMGAPGAGKTRLAFEAAARLAKQFAGGVYVCELAPVAAPALVRTAIATALEFAPDVTGDLGALVRDRFGYTPTLIVLDNCEHVRAEVAVTMCSILSAAPGLRALATSRERLRITGETAWTLPSLSLEEALQLLAMRIAAVDATFAVTADSRSALVEICERLERLPMALELVAPRLALLPASQVAHMLNAALGLLSGGEGPSRHRTMTAALDWSVALLPTTSALDLWRLSVFPATFTLDAAATALEASSAKALDRLAVLRDASLLVADTSGASARFRLLEPVRQYALAHLAGGPIEDEVRRLHASYVLDKAEWIGARLLGTPEQAAALEAFAELLPDLRQAVAWSQHAVPGWGARIVGHTGWAWEITSRLREGEALMRSTLDVATGAQDRARLLLRLMSLVNRRSYAKAASLSPEAISAATSAGDRRELGLVLSYQTNFLPSDAAAQQLDNVANIAAETGDELVRSWERFFRGWLCENGGDARAARACFEESASITSRLGDRWLTTQVTADLIRMCLELGDNEAARQHLLSIVPALIDHSDWVAAPSLLFSTARLASRVGRPSGAFRLIAAQRRLRDEIGLYQWDTTEIELAARAHLHDGLQESRYLAEGERLTLGEALALARGVLENSAAPPEGPKRGRDILTRREREVAQLVQEGLTSREIATRLFITERTAEGHVEQIRNKLGFHSRAQVAAWVARQRLSAGSAKAGTKDP
jgi:non-specific serine/threonine protein kinase